MTNVNNIFNRFLFVILITISPCLVSFSQEDNFYNNLEQPEPESTLKVFLANGIGINNHCGVFGFLAEYAPVKKFSLVGALGLGTWGVKSGLGIRYYNRGFPHKFFYGLTYTSAGGIQGVEYELETTTESKEKVEFNLNRANNIAATFGYQWKLFRNGRLNIETGYSFPLQEKAYEVITDGVTLSEDSKTLMQSRTPGGFILAVAFSIGF